MRDAAEAVAHHLILAHETLLDPTRRAAYMRRLHAGAAAPSAPPRQKRAVSAQTHRAKAEALLRRNDYAGALQEADRAFRFEHSAKNEAFYGWLLYLRHSAGGRVHPSAKKHLQRALQRDPECEQAHFYTACLLKQSGHEEQAYAHFRRALKANPDNQEAQREARLYESRRKRDQPGLFQRLLQREQAKKRSVG
jgi:tetratricopeptide (TPR) repeat protein